MSAEGKIRKHGAAYVSLHLHSAAWPSLECPNICFIHAYIGMVEHATDMRHVHSVQYIQKPAFKTTFPDEKVQFMSEDPLQEC
jgi:hypothetical protein